MRPRLAIRRARLITPRQSLLRSPCLRTFTYHTQLTTKSRPNLPFLAIPITNRAAARYLSTERKRWLKHEAKLAVRYTASFWGIIFCAGVILWLVNEEGNERKYPTPHEWRFMTRKILRDANIGRDPKNGEVNWAMAMELSRGCVLRLEDPKFDGTDVAKLSDHIDPDADIPGEFIACDITAKSEEWRRGYFEAIMLAAKASEHTDGWVRDTTRNVISPPNFVIGPSNPRPTPIPAGQPHAPREEDCVIAYPSADSFYMKILATKGFTSRQRLEAALEYASFMEFKQREEGPEALYHIALAEATQGMDMTTPPYNPKTFVLDDKAGPPPLNILDTITAIANSKARSGNMSAALPIYLSLLKARRFLPNDPPKTQRTKRHTRSIYQQLVDYVSPPAYPPPPPDGTESPWRSPQEKCQEASLSLYIGEILFASSSRHDGLSWTRDSVDMSEEQLRGMGPTTAKADKQTCRECLSAGLENWSTMVAKLVREEEKRKEQGSQSGVFSFWSGAQANEGRWTAEDAVVKERTRRTKELLEDVTPAASTLMSYFKA